MFQPVYEAIVEEAKMPKRKKKSRFLSSRNKIPKVQMESEEEFMEEGEESPGNSKTSDNDTVTESCLQNSWDTISYHFVRVA